VPYLWGTVGLGSNAEKVKAAVGAEARVDSLALIFDPESARRLSSCGIAIVDEPASVVPAALLHLGKPPMSRDPRDLATAMQLLAPLRPLIRTISLSDYAENLATGSLCAVLGYSGEVVRPSPRPRISIAGCTSATLSRARGHGSGST